MAEIVIGRTRTTWDVILGLLLIIAGLVILAHAMVATRVSVLFLGWMLMFSGVLGLISALVNLRRGGFWSSAIAGGLMTVVGLMILRHADAAAVTLTLVAGSLFLATGIVRLIAAGENAEYRWPLLLGGAISTVLGLIVLLNLFDVSYTLLGVLLGIETLAEGIAMVLVGRVRVTGVVGVTRPGPAQV